MIATRVRPKVNFGRSNFAISIAVLCACLACAVSAAAFQRRTPHKLRALGLLEVNPDGIGVRLVPIAILDNGRFHDAGIYEPKPRPMALDDGVVYEAQITGMPAGTFTVTGGQRIQDTWIAQGIWIPRSENASSKPKGGPPSGSVPVRNGDDRPILHRPPPGGDTASPAQPAAKAPVTPTPTPAPAPEDPDRPKLRRSEAGAEAPASTTSTATPAGAPGKAVTAKSAEAAHKGREAYVAVSDAQTTETRSYEYIWKAGELQEAEGKLRKLAIAQIPAVKGKTAPAGLTNVVIRSFDLDLTNDAVMVLTAEVPGAPVSPGKHFSRYVAVIARLSGEGEMTKLAASVTDSSRLDVAPRMELIDAVDAEGDGLGELLFREYSFDDKSFVIYRIGRTTVTTLFEGASQPLK